LLNYNISQISGVLCHCHSDLRIKGLMVINVVNVRPVVLFRLTELFFKLNLLCDIGVFMTVTMKNIVLWTVTPYRLVVF
jgi:hypothetical protein